MAIFGVSGYQAQTVPTYRVLWGNTVWVMLECEGTKQRQSLRKDGLMLHPQYTYFCPV